MTSSFSTICWLCGKSLALESCKTDEHGHAIHESCQVLRLALAKPPQSVKSPPRRTHRPRA